MAFNKEGNAFTFGFSIIMVLVVATLLSLAAVSLKPFQKANQSQEKMKDILTSVAVMTEDDDMGDAPPLFEKFITKRLVLNYTGEVIGEFSGKIDENDKSDPFNIDVKKEYKNIVKKILNQYKGNKEKQVEELTKADVNYPLFICEKDGKSYYVIPMVGTGLWGPLWGYLALEDDYKTCFGASFDHKTETPGLGAEIKEPLFEAQFKGERILDENGKFVSIKVMKGGAPADYPHGVDAITGGTITSNGVSEMLQRTLNIYVRYFEKQKNG
ncbi:MAG: NADH:ubiquinone reductase (Na(+)-transporting) subunit C [Flavobacteriales bacterium]|nr:MAG: NADH:ubiquinone reductase (Na(+)-transporting) subunit C [Flavobacteriales bacterium]